MGAWGSGLYANDSTCDVRDSYIKHLQEGLGNEEVYVKIQNEFKDYIGGDEEPLFWFALAETQWRTGRLLPEVREKALDWIEKGGGLELWEESKNGGAGWKKTLHNLKIKLNTPIPAEKKFRKPKEFNYNFGNINDVYAMRLHGELAIEKGVAGKYMLIQKIGEIYINTLGKDLMQIQVFDRIFDELPSLSDMDGIRLLPLSPPNFYRTNMGNSSRPLNMNALMHLYKVRLFPSEHLFYIGNRQGPLNTVEGSRIEDWYRLDGIIYYYHLLWDGIEIENIDEGVYVLKNE